jgi:hypothetical protein
LTVLAVSNNATNIAFTLAASIIIARAFRIVLPVRPIGTGSREPSPLFFFAPTLAGRGRIESAAALPIAANDLPQTEVRRIGRIIRRIAAEFRRAADARMRYRES